MKALSRTRKSFVALAAVAVLIVSGATSVVSAEDAQAVTMTKRPSTTFTVAGFSGRVNGNATTSAFQCGVLACNTSVSPYGQAIRTGGGKPNGYRVKLTSTHKVVTGSVSVGSGGPSLGFQRSGSSCTTGWHNGATGYNYVAISTSGEVCTGRGISAQIPSLTVGGSFRVGSTWYSRNASA